ARIEVDIHGDDELFHFRHRLGADPVAGKKKELARCHGDAFRERCLSAALLLSPAGAARKPYGTHWRSRLSAVTSISIFISGSLSWQMIIVAAGRISPK